MSSNYISFNFHSNLVPALSQDTASIVKEQGLELPFCLLFFKNKAEKLHAMEAKLMEAKQHVLRDRVVSVLATALFIGIIAAGTLVIYYYVSKMKVVNQREVALALTTFATFITVIVLSILYCKKWGEHPELADNLV